MCFVHARRLAIYLGIYCDFLLFLNQIPLIVLLALVARWSLAISALDMQTLCLFSLMALRSQLIATKGHSGECTITDGLHELCELNEHHQVQGHKTYTPLSLTGMEHLGDERTPS